MVLVFCTQAKIQSVLQRALLCPEEERALKGHKVKDSSKSNEMIRISGTKTEIREYRPKGKQQWSQEQTAEKYECVINNL